MWLKARVAYSIFFRSVRQIHSEGVLDDDIVFLGTVIHFPSWFPGAGFKKDADIYKRKLNNCRDLPYEIVKRELVRSIHARVIVFF